MPKNKIQFQRGLSLPEFLAKYGSNNQCRAALVKFRWPNGFACPSCGNDTYYEIGTRILFQCKACRRQVPVIISETIFSSTNLPLSILFFGIYQITQSKNGISSLNLARSLEISANAALRIKHKLKHVMKKREDGKPLSGFLQIDGAYLGGKSLGGKRGRGADGKTPFIAAVTTNKKGSQRTRSLLGQASMYDRGALLFPMCFTGLDTVCTHRAIITGGDPDRAKIP